MVSFLNNASILTLAKKGKNSVFLPLLSKIFKTLINFGESGIIKENLEFPKYDKEALAYGSIVLVADDLKKTQSNCEDFSKLIPYKYDTFNKGKDINNTIKEKVNAFIKRTCNNAAIPEFNLNIQSEITNLILVSFFGIKLKWGYCDVDKTKINFCNNEVNGFCIPFAKCAARLYKKNYLLVRIPVNGLSYNSMLESKKKEEKKEGITDFIEPWKENDGKCQGITKDYLYLTMVMKASENLKENSREIAILRNDKDPEDLCKVGEELIIDSLLYPTMTTEDIRLTMPNINTRVKFIIDNDNNNEYVDKGSFDKQMKYFAQDKSGRKITLDYLATESKVKINDQGVVVTGTFCSVATDFCSKIKPYTLNVDVPFVYTLSAGDCIIAAGIHNK